VLLRPGVAYVVSPLKALMRDQVAKLQERKIPGTFINGDLGPTEKRRRYELLHRGALKFVYCTPERFAPDRVRPAELKELLSVGPRWFIIDEAHCIVRWGRDFRPTYGRLGVVREHLGAPQVLAFTATAGKATQEEILHSLGIPDARVVFTGVDRPNIAIARLEMDDDRKRLELVRELYSALSAGRMMIFVPTVRVGQRLQSDLKTIGIEVPFYHSKLGSATEKEMLLSRFTGRIHPPLNAVICTNAFGMGIDVSDVRVVLHWQPPASVEDYLQEYGRAGRDGRPAVAILLTSDRDEGLLRFMAEKTTESANVDPSEGTELLNTRFREIATMIEMSKRSRKCFRGSIADYFGLEEKGRVQPLALRIIAWIFSRNARVVRAPGCCDRCDKITSGNVVEWARRVTRAA
jgi:RecQ family ATP-dependent DNA helicase